MATDPSQGSGDAQAPAGTPQTQYPSTPQGVLALSPEQLRNRPLQERVDAIRRTADYLVIDTLRAEGLASSTNQKELLRILHPYTSVGGGS